MTTLANEYVIVRSETVVTEYVIEPVARALAPVRDVIPVPWRRVAVGATLGVLAGIVVSSLHVGPADPWILATSIIITSAGLALMGSLAACLSSVATHR
jgi:hypothetical protein